MRAAWSSIRRIRRSSSAGSRDPPCRYSSAKPLMVVRGVRSSWLASATKRRIRSSERLAASSERRALASEAALAPKADSIWASMVLRARPSRPTSVRGSRSGTRRVRSPAAIALAVCSISTSGRRLARTMTAPTPARASSTTTLTTRSMSRSWRVVLSMPSRLAATTTLPPPRSGCTATRQRPSPPVAGTVAVSLALLLEPGGVVGQPGRLLALLQELVAERPLQLAGGVAVLDQVRARGGRRAAAGPARLQRLVGRAPGDLLELVVQAADQVAVEGGHAGQPDEGQGHGHQGEHGHDELDLEGGPGRDAPDRGRRPRGHGSGSRRT